MVRTGWIASSMLLAVCIAPKCSHAQSNAAELSGLAHVALRVSDVDREVTFLGKLGFEQAFANTENGRTTQAFIKVNDRQFIEVYPQAVAGEQPGPLGFMHACYETADLKTLSTRYEAAGLKPASFRKAGAGNMLFNLQDPDGRVTEFTQYLPGSRQMNDAGQHLGAQRVSDQLLGFDMPEKDMKAAQLFYESLGFNLEKKGDSVWFSLTSNSALRIELHPSHSEERPQLFFSIKNVRRAANELKDAGASVEHRGKLLVVRDPDDNSFIFMETDK